MPQSPHVIQDIKGNDEYPLIEFTEADKTSDVGKLLYLWLLSRHGYKEAGEDKFSYAIDGFQCPLIYCGPSDLTNDDYKDTSTWKAGPVKFSWDATTKCWVAGGGSMPIHHHRDNSATEGGVAHAYFFR